MSERHESIMRRWQGSAMKTIAFALAALIAAPALAAPPKPKLIVAISVDQFSADLYARYRAGYTDGLKRLSGGMRFVGYQSHAGTETCPGHSTILTGRHPAATGIVLNEWYDRASAKQTYCVDVPGAGPDAKGPQFLRVDTLGDWLKTASPASQVVSISGKDRAAIMLGGHHADAVYWWDDGKGFVTSRYAGPVGVEVIAPAERFNGALFAGWKQHAPVLWPTAASATCAPLVKQRTFGGMTRSGDIPPDQAKGLTDAADFMANKDFQTQFRFSPAFDPLTAEFAEQVIEARKLGRGAGTDLLAVSFSATDFIGHRYGPGGAEMCAQMAALDGAIGRLLAALDRTGVPYVVALTADHGGSDAPERLSEQGVTAQRVDGGALGKALNADLRAKFGLETNPIVADEPQQLYVRATEKRAAIAAAAIAWLKVRPEVVSVFTADQVAAAIPAKGKPAPSLTMLERLNESYDPARSGDIFVVFADHTTLGWPKKPTDYVSGHGSPYDYDRRVPILFWWKGVAAAARNEAIETVDIAPTLATVAGVPVPEVDGRCLTSVAGRCR